MLLAIAELLSAWLVANPALGPLGALFGTLSMGLAGYAAVLAQVLLIAFVTAATSRHIVNRTLDTIR